MSSEHLQVLLSSASFPTTFIRSIPLLQLPLPKHPPNERVAPMEHVTSKVKSTYTFTSQSSETYYNFEHYNMEQLSSDLGDTFSIAQ